MRVVPSRTPTGVARRVIVVAAVALTICVPLVLPQRSAAATRALVLQAESWDFRDGDSVGSATRKLSRSGISGAYVNFTATGIYTVRVVASGQYGVGAWPEIGVALDGVVGLPLVVDSSSLGAYVRTIHVRQTGVHSVGVSFLNDACSGGEDRNVIIDRLSVTPPRNATRPSRATAERYDRAAAERERLALAGTAADIRRVRTGPVTLRLAGDPSQLAGAVVRARLTRHDFAFGGNLPKLTELSDTGREQQYLDRWLALFHVGTLGFWSALRQYVDDRQDWTPWDRRVAWARANGVDVKGHSLLWGHRQYWPLDATGAGPSSAVQRAVVEQVMTRYGGAIDAWEVVNEASHYADPAIADPHRWAHAADPDGRLIVSDFGAFADGGPYLRRFLARTSRDGTPWNAIGLQCYEPCDTEGLPLQRVQTVLRSYARLGRPIYVTECEVASDGRPVAGQPGAVWDEQAQADYVERLYRVLFANPAVSGITYWGFSDSTSFRPRAGLLRADGTPKPAYERLDHLINEEWTTDVTRTVGDTGRATFRGYYGTYEVTVTTPAGDRTFAVETTRGGPTDFTLSLR